VARSTSAPHGTGTWNSEERGSTEVSDSTNSKASGSNATWPWAGGSIRCTRGATLVMSDVGMVPYYSKLRVIDVFSLVTKEIVLLRRERRKWPKNSPEYVRSPSGWSTRSFGIIRSISSRPEGCPCWRIRGHAVRSAEDLFLPGRKGRLGRVDLPLAD